MKKILLLILLIAAALPLRAAIDPDGWGSFLTYTQKVDFKDPATGLNFAINSINPFNVSLMGSVEIEWGDYSDCDCPVKHIYEFNDFEGLPTNEYSGDLVIPDFVLHNGTMWGVSRISMGCFNQCTELTSVRFPTGILEIRRGAFNGCSALTEVKPGIYSDVIPPLPTAEVFLDAFKGCTSLKKVDLRFARKIYGGIFRECPNLEEVQMYCADNETEAFGSREVPSLKKITISFHFRDQTKKITGTNTFFPEEYETTEVIVPQGTLDRFKAHSVWGRFKNLHEAGEAYVEAPQTAPEWEVIPLSNNTFRIIGEFEQGEVYTLDGAKLCDLTADNPDFTLDRHGIMVIKIDNSTKKILF